MGWHINSNHPLSEDYIPTVVKVESPSSIGAGAVQYPKAEEVELQFSGGDKLSVFSGFLMLSVPLTAAADFKPAPGDMLTVSVDYQACDNLECLRPTTISSSIALVSLQGPASVSDAGAAAIVQDGSTIYSRITDGFSAFLRFCSAASL